MLSEITELELSSIKDTLLRIKDEADTVAEYCDTVFNSGALEGIEESLVIVNGLLNSLHKRQIVDSFLDSLNEKQMEEDFDEETFDDT